MALAVRFFTVLLGVALLSGCNALFGVLGSSSGGSVGSSDNDRGLIAFRLAHVRGTAGEAQADPLRRPRHIRDHPNYPFNNAIPFMPRGAGEYVSSGFGWRNLWGRADFHCGVDVVADAGTPVYAVVGGRVTFTRSAGRRGGVVIYAHGRQYTYWHVNPHRGLSDGDWVRAGQSIGTIANWGSNTHLHYALYLTGNNASPNARETTNCVDPMEMARNGLF